MNTHAFSRVERLVGPDGLARLHDARVILFGVGGVGGWCAEALVRSGIGHLVLVDPDCVDVTNINRQLPATTKTTGRPKVEVVRARLLDINPLGEVSGLPGRHPPADSGSQRLSGGIFLLHGRRLQNGPDKGTRGRIL